jgi:ATP synthase A1 C subunit
MDLSYFNSRVRGLRGRLLTAADYEALINLKSAEECLTHLRATHYGPYIERAGVRLEGAWPIVSTAMSRNLADTFALLWNVAPAPARPLLKAVLSYWEVSNLKAVIRGLARGLKRDEIRSVFIPAGEFDPAALSTLLGAKGIEDLIRFLDTWTSPYAAPLKRGLPGYLKHKNVIELELELDLFVYGYILSTAGGRTLDEEITREVVGRRVDAVNIMTLLKVAGEDFSREGAGSVFIEGGRALDRSAFVELGTLKTREEVTDGLVEAIRDPLLRGVLAGSDPDDPAAIEELLDEALSGRLRKLAVVEPLSIALGVYYLFSKVREIKNLRFITRGKLFSIPPDELERYVYYRQ